MNGSRDLLSFGVFTRSAHRFPPANRHKHERIPASVMDGLDDKFPEDLPLWLKAGVQQRPQDPWSMPLGKEPRCLAVRSRPVQQLLCRLPRTQRQSPKTRPMGIRLGAAGFLPVSTKNADVNFLGWMRLKRSLRHRCSAAECRSCRLRSPFSFCSINGCVYNGRRRGRKMRRGGVEYVMWSGEPLVQQIK